MAPSPALLRTTRRLTVLAVVFLGIQLYGNLYEEIVTNAAVIADPPPGGHRHHPAQRQLPRPALRAR